MKGSLISVSVLLVLAVGLAVGPIWLKGVEWPTGPLKLPDYTGWLQGALTPLALIIAGIGFIVQARAQDRANRLASRALVLGNLHALTGHIGYMCAASLDAQFSSAANVHPDLELSNMTGFLKRAAQENPDYWDGDARATKQQIINSAPFQKLGPDIRELIAFAEDAELGMLVDQRIRWINDRLKTFK